jgi:hypothetical protein
MTILQKNAFGMSMQDVQEYKEKISQIIEGFVDDTSIFTNDDGTSIDSLRNKLESDGTWWAGLLDSSGGKLELTKCFYYLLSWKWDQKGNPIAQTSTDQLANSMETRISLNKESENPIFLEQKEVNSCHKTLGTYKCLVGSEDDHYKFLKEKSDNLAKLTSSSQFNRRQAQRALNSCYVPALTYSLTAVNLNAVQIDKIQQPATTVYLRKCGYEMNFPRKLVYSPVIYGGIGFRQLSVESISKKIESLICHINDKSLLGKSMEIILNWTQLHTGLESSILTNDNDINYIQKNWFSQFVNF